jgi:hypothetical protein
MSVRGELGAALAVIGLLLPVGAAFSADEAPAADAEPELPDTWYAQVMAHSDAGINVTHFWSKGRALRSETVMAGRRVVTIVTADTYYAYDLLVRTGIAVQRAPLAVQQDSERRRPFGNEYFSLIRQGAELVRSETLAGRTVEIYQITNDDGRVRIWVPPDEKRLPLRLKVFRRATGQEFVTDYLNWQRGLPIVDEFFRPEPGVSMLLMTYQEYVDRQATREALGPVPVLYGDLLHGY